jgi:hypothetical protein
MISNYKRVRPKFLQRDIQRKQKMLRCIHVKKKAEKDMEQESWLKKSEKLLTDVKEWRRAHPKATFVEIEDEIHQRLMQLEAHLLQEAAEASASREWGKASEPEERPQCPNCAVARPRARETAAHPARQWRSKCDAHENLWNLPQVWGEFFSLSIKS